MRILSMLLALLLLLAGCATASSQPTSETGLPTSSSSAAPQVDAALVALALEQARIYEQYCGGVDFSKEASSDGTSLPFGVLKENGLLADYADATGQEFSIPNNILMELDVFFMGAKGSDEAFPPEGVSTYSTAFMGTSYPLEVETMQADEKGVPQKITFKRRSPKPEQISWFYPVTYTVSYKTLGKEDFIPAPLKSLYRVGDVVCQIDAVANGTQETPEAGFTAQTIDISTPEQLMALSQQVNSGSWSAHKNSYRLTADLDMTGLTFIPIGQNQLASGSNWDARDPTQIGFNAFFDGQGHTISNLTIETPAAVEQKAYVGLFSVIGPQGRVENLKIENASVRNDMGFEQALYGVATGLLAGESSGTLKNIHATGKVFGSYQVGGLLGRAEGRENGESARIENCTAEAEVRGSSYLGGFVGMMHWTEIVNCAAQGTTIVEKLAFDKEMPRAVGGFAGSSVAAVADTCFADVTIFTNMEAACVGHFMGMNEGQVRNTFYNSEKGSWDPIDYNTDSQDAVGLTSAEMKERLAALFSGK